MNKLITLALLTSFFFSCGSPSVQNKEEKNLDDFKWFLGNWKGKLQEMDVHETWTEENKNSFSGKGVVMLEKDTLFHESTKLCVQDGNIVYIADVPGNPAPVSFKLISYEDNKAVFENPEHDFPKTIIYTLIAPDSLIATVVGSENGTPRKEEFYFKKMK